MTDLSREAWSCLLEQLDDPPVGTVAEALANARKLDIGTAYDAVEDAIDGGILVKEVTGGAFNTVRVAEADESPDSGEKEDRGTGSEPSDPQGEAVETPDEEAVAALDDAIAWFHTQLNRTIRDHTDSGEHPGRPTTARDYFTDVRGWDDETIDDMRLGWAPARRTGLLDHLMGEGHDREAIMGTGLFTDDLTPLWQGRYVLPYFNGDGDPVYAIARCTGSKGGGRAGYEGHPDDGLAGKYAKLRHTDDRVPFDEPIWGHHTLTGGEPVVVAEGIADAITAAEAGYAVLSPVAKEFKKEHYDPLLDAIEAFDVPRVTIVPDSERAGFDAVDSDGSAIRDRVTIPATSPGMGGALRTADHLGERLADTDREALVAELPLPAAGEAFHKVDLDDYLNRWSGDLDPVLASAKPAETFAAYDAATATTSSNDSDEDRDHGGAKRSGDGGSALWGLDLHDLEGLSDGERTKNPFAHTGDSETYFVAHKQSGGDVIAKDYKGKGDGVTYNALTALLVDAGKRRRDDPEGSLSDAEVFYAWRQAKRKRNDLDDEDPVPYRGMVGIAVEDELVDEDELIERDAETGAVADGDGDTYRALPPGTYDDVLQHIREEHDVEPGREPARANDADDNDGEDAEDSGGEYTEDSRDLLGLDVVVEPGDAMRAARAVTPEDLDRPLPELERDDVDDIAIAVALADGVIDSPDVFPRDDGYTEAYYRARDVFGAPLPKYLDNSTLTERFDLVKAALDRVGPEHILDTLRSTITVEDPPSQAIAKIDPTWEDSESGERIVAGYGSGFWCTEHDVSFTPLQLVALEHGIIDDEDAYPTGEGYKRAYRLLREEYGAPIPRWRANVFEEVGVLPPAVRVVDDDLSARDTFSLDEARKQTEELVRDALTTRDRAQLVTVIPGGGKTFSTAIVADDEPVLYAPPRNELKKQMEEYAREIRDSDEFDAEPSAYHLPILAEDRVPEVGINAATAAVRGGEVTLQDREALRETVEEHLEAVEEDDDGEAANDDSVDLDRATCPAAEGDHGDAWQIAIQVAHALGFDPATIHRNARTLFGEELPCRDGGACDYTEGWDVVREPGACPDILIGSAGHAHVDSATSYYREDDSGQTVTDPRAVVVDEFPSDTYATEYGERYMDHAVWLAEALAGVENREELLAAGLNTDTWVSLWLRGEAEEHAAAGEAIDALRAGADLLDAVETAEDLLDRDPMAIASGSTSANLRGVVDVLERLVDGGLGVDDVAAITDVLGSAAEVLTGDADRAYADGREEAGRLYGLADTLREDILQPLDAAAAELGDDSLADAIADRTAGLPIAGDLRQLVDDAVGAAEGDAPRELVEAAADALQGGRDGCRALAVGADGGYAHPDAWALLAGAIAEPDDDGVSVGTQRTLSLGDGGEGLQHKNLTVNGADIHVDRDHHGAVVFDRPSFTDRDGGKCPLVGLDATARRDLWRIALGRDAEVRDIHDTTAERRRHIREGMNHTVVQTANTPLPYHGDPSGRNFQEDLAVVRAAAEEYTGPGGLDDKAPAVISTKKVLNYLDEELDEIAEETVNYENMKGSDALGSYQVLAILGSQHYGDTEPERWAMYAGESADRGDTGGDTLDYGSDVANTYLKHMREDHTMQAILRAGRNDDRSVVVAHTSALRDDLPVVAEGATVSAHSKGALAVAEAAAGLNDRSFTAADVAERIRDDDRGVGLRQVQNILADLRSSGYLQVESEGSRGREYEYSVDEDPGLADVELPEPGAVADGEPKTKSELLDTYSWNFVLDRDADVGEGMLPPSTPTIPAGDTAETLVEGAPPG